jgi:hypothetical protein
MSLENIIKNTGKGTLTGFSNIVDPFGYLVSDIDYWISGAGHSQRNKALPTFNNFMYQLAYKSPNEKNNFSDGYVPRFAGNIVGAFTGYMSLYTAYFFYGATAAIAAPVILGLYGVGGSIIRYGCEIIDGEKIGKDKFEEASIYQGFKLGYHETTHFPLMHILHNFEGDISGRSLGKNRIKSSIKNSAGNMRRNFRALLGYTGGLVIGSSISILTLGILPLYKTVRDIVYNLDHE